ncbi:general secretion pathway protein H [Pseudomonas sp. ok272]|uniref:type II secretion system minor pseudopilin GspH n=1 Tax=unclassified Pseudomonas TaxID=196821 RepID=UPI0008B5B4E5|nr:MULTISPECIES: type II secretion system minor pseudopilin GspH [unclassified Pseudomonas]SEN33994.1 general secretion pathway protein H [Pseudomonas sp. ok272]SFM84717.1 general secretion pathway protein H [Pseudomonas sp. ok602]
MGRRCQGFTLLELMVVMVLIGVLLGMVQLAGGNDPARQARQEASGLIQLLHSVREQAVLEGREYGLRLAPEEYQLLVLEHQQWRPVGNVRRMPHGVQLSLAVAGQPSARKAQEDQPQVLILSSDENTPFTARLLVAGQSVLSLSSDGLNEAVLDE